MSIIRLNKDLYFDHRGYVGRLFTSEGKWEHRVSKSKLGSIRGFHGDDKTRKIVFCLSGSMQLIMFEPKTKYKYDVVLTEHSFGVMIPPGFLNAHQCLSESCLLYYAWDQPYTGPDDQWSVHYNDETIKPAWLLHPDENLISDRDKNAPKLTEMKFE